MLNKIIPIVHLIIAFFYSFYAFIFPKNFLYDYFYFVFLICVQLSWIYFNHECPLSYLYKKLHYKNYECGDTTTLDDFKELIHNTSSNGNSNDSKIDYTKLVDTLFTIGLIISILMVEYRSNISNIFVSLFVLVFIRFAYLLFNNAMGWNTKTYLGSKYRYFKKLYDNYNIKTIHNEVNNVISIIMITFFIYITYKNRKRF